MDETTTNGHGDHIAVQDTTYGEVVRAVTQARKVFGLWYDSALRDAGMLATESERELRIAEIEKRYEQLMGRCKDARDYLAEGIAEVGGEDRWGYDEQRRIFYIRSATSRHGIHAVQEGQAIASCRKCDNHAHHGLTHACWHWAQQTICSDCKAFDNGKYCWHRAAHLAVALHFDELHARGWQPIKPRLTKTLAEVQAEADEMF